jgi:SAM-dependent methyltransferase
MDAPVTYDEKIKEAVRKTYGEIARRHVGTPAGTGRASCCGPSKTVTEESIPASCCGPTEQVVESSAFTVPLYSAGELIDLPSSVTDASLGCGNPTAIAGLKPGEVVLDLGSGGGIDCFLAARQVGPEGQVIGLDMTTDMIKLARRNAKKMGVTNVDFRYGEMEELPLPDESVDVIISNCVINLSPDKDAVFGEAFRVLRPGGRMMVSDIVVDGNLPEPIRHRLDAWVGCIAGALDESIYLDKIRAAGFGRVEVKSRNYLPADLGLDEEKATLTEANLSLDELAKMVASVNVTAYRPG